MKFFKEWIKSKLKSLVTVGELVRFKPPLFTNCQKKIITGNLICLVCISREDFKCIRGQRSDLCGNKSQCTCFMTLEHHCMHSGLSFLRSEKRRIVIDKGLSKDPSVDSKNVYEANFEVVCKYWGFTCQECSVFVKSRVQILDTPAGARKIYF